MKVTLPDSLQALCEEQFKATTSWFTFFQDVWKAIRGGLGIAIGGTLSVNSTSTPNSGSGETDLMSYSIPPLKDNGDEIFVKAWGVFAANANNKTIKLKFGGQTIFDTGAIAANNGSWLIEASILRIGNTTQEIIVSIMSSNTSVVETTTRTAGTQDLTIANTLVLTGQGTSSSDIIQYAMIVKLTPNN